MSKSKKGQREDFKQEDVLQAVVLADSFNIRFTPVTLDKPRALIPLVNVPLLDYTLEFLTTAGIEEIIIFCCCHADQIKEYIASSKWSSSGCPCDITTVVGDRCLSMGDALREIDTRGLVKSDFVLVNGDIISNVRLKDIVNTHKERRKKEKTPIMTILLKQVPPGHVNRSKEEEVVMLIKPEGDRVLHYHKSGSSKKFEMPLCLFQEHKDVNVHYDLLDTSVSICSPQVPLLFTENFDYETRDDFIRGILVNEEILGNTIHVHVLENEYSSRVSNLSLYDSISKDVINRWSYPHVPDSAITNQSDDRYSYGRNNIYLHKDVVLERGSILEENVIIGKNSFVDADSHISNSVIGKNCHIGKNVKIDGSYIWDNVRIEDNSVLKTALVAESVDVKCSVTIQAGCVLGSKVIVGPNVILPPGTMLMSSEAAELDSERSYDVADPSLIGSEGVAYQYSLPSDTSDEELDRVTQELWGLQINQSDEEDDISSESDLSDQESLPDSPPPDDTKLFLDEVIGTLERAMEENIGVDNLVLEINSLKHAYNIQIKEVNVLLTHAIFELPCKKNDEVDKTKYLTEFKSNFKKMMPLLKNYIKSSESQKDCIFSLEDLAVQNGVVESVINQLLHILYQVDLLSEEVILEWHEEIPPSITEDIPERENIRKQAQTFITWLQEAEEESDSDED